jgi:hypothetical protein
MATSKFKKFLKGCGILFGLFILLCIIAIATSEPSEEPVVADENVQTIPYETVSSSGNTDLILISKEYVNADDMLVLGQQLARENEDVSFAYVSVFSDQQAIDVRDAVIAATATPEQDVLYDLYFVGQYNKNKGNGYEEYVVRLDGIGTTETTYDASDLK